MGRTIDPMAGGQKGAARRPLLRPSVSMSLRLVIPWRVALQQSPPPLHQPGTILNKESCFEKEILFNHIWPTNNSLNGWLPPIGPPMPYNKPESAQQPPPQPHPT